jgi:TRAP-type C4-dicarboxylate transport system permease small subunit
VNAESSAPPPSGGLPEAPEDNGAAPAGSGFYRLLGRIEVWIATFAVVAMTLLVLTSAASRTAGHPQSWTVDLATFSFAWAVFLGADIALRSGKMITIDLVIDRFPPRLRAWLRLVNSGLVIVFLVAMVVLGLQLSYTTQDRTFNGLPWLSYTWVTLSVPVGCALMLYTMSYLVRAQIKQIRRAAS